MLLKQRKAKSKTKLTKQEDSINLLVWFYNLIFNYYGKNYRWWIKKPTISEVNKVISDIDNTLDLNKPISNATREALNNKANLEHTHKYSTILDTPTALKNPEPLIIQGNEYDGSVRTEINIQNSSSNVIEGGGL